MLTIRELDESNQNTNEISDGLSQRLSDRSMAPKKDKKKLLIDPQLRSDWISKPNTDYQTGKNFMNEVGIRNKPVTESITSTPTHQGARTVGTPASTKGRRAPGQTNIEVGNLKKQITDRKLKEFFRQCEGLKSAKVDENTRNWTSIWGELDFDTAKQAEDAITKYNVHQDKSITDGRPLEVTWDRGFAAPTPLTTTMPASLQPDTTQAANMESQIAFPLSIKIDNIKTTWNEYTVTGKLTDALGDIGFEPKPVILLRPPRATHCSVMIKLEDREEAQEAARRITLSKLYGSEELHVTLISKPPILPEPPIGRIQLDNVCYQWTNAQLMFRVKEAIGDKTLSKSLRVIRLFPIVPHYLSTKSFILQFHSPAAAHQALRYINNKMLTGPTVLQATVLPPE